MRSGPLGSAPVSMRALTLILAARACKAKGRKLRPASVRVTRRPRRSNSGIPSSSSRP